MIVDAIVAAPFKSTREALAFAFKDRISYPRSIMLRMASINSQVARDRGLGSYEGAAIAGTIMRLIDTSLSDTDAAIMTARFSVRSVPCECGKTCCKGSRPNPGWLEAVLLLTENLPNPFPETRANRTLREAIIRKYFGESLSFAKAAEQARVHRDTASNHNSKIVKMLREDERRSIFVLGSGLESAGLVSEGGL